MNRLHWLLPATLLLAGCDNFLIGKEGLIRDRSQEYEVSQTMPRIEVPEGLEANPMRDVLSVPDIGTAAIRTEREFEVPRPDFFYAEAGNEVVNLSRTEAGRMIVVDEPVEQVWQEVVSFWDYNEIAVAAADPHRGVLETEWMTDENTRPGFFSRMLGTVTFSDVEGPYRDKLRARVTPVDGDSPGQTAIQLQHVRAPESQQVVDWSAEGEDVSYKSQIMYDLLHFLSKATEKTTANSLRARSTDAKRAFLGRDADGHPVLKLTSDIDTSWGLINVALDAAQIDVGSSDRELGKYYVTYATTLAVEPPKRGGGVGSFFGWLHGDREDIKLDTSGVAGALGGGDSEDDEQQKYSSKTVAPKTEQQELQERDGYKIWLGGKVIYVFGGGDGSVKENKEEGTVSYSGRYQVQVTRRSSGVYVSVLDDEAERAPAPVAEDLLWNIKEHLPAG